MAVNFEAATPLNRLVNLAGRKSREAQDVSVQIGTGLRFQTYEGLAGEGTSERYVGLQSARDDINSFTRSNNTTVKRLDTLDAALSQLKGIADNISQTIANRRNSAAGEAVPVQAIADAALEDIASKLNIQFDGRYLFSGSKTNTPAVGNIKTNTIGSGDIPTGSYYQGDDKLSIVRSAEGKDTAYGALGNDAAFQNLIGAVHLAIEGDNNNDLDQLGKAFDLVSEAVVGIASIQAENRAIRGGLEITIDEHEQVGLLLDQNIVDISETDLVKASTQLQELQTIVEATYLAFSRLSGLSLAKFL